MGAGAKAAAGNVGAATVYSLGRVTANATSWLQSLAVVSLQAVLMKQMMDKQHSMYDKISTKQIEYLETAVDHFVNMVEGDVIPRMRAAYPDVPRAAEFVPVDVLNETRKTMENNVANMPAAKDMVERLNNYHRLNYIARLYFLSPESGAAVKLEGVQILSLIQGKLPVDDLTEVLTDIAEMAALTGRIGNTGRQTAASLGLTRLRMQAAGREALHASLASLNANVSPIAAEGRMEDYLHKPANQIAFALQQGELIQASLQNVFNTAAQKPPHLLAEIQAKMQMVMAKLQLEANRGNLVNQFVPNFAGVMGPAFQSFADSMVRKSDVDRSAEQMHPAGSHPVLPVNPT